MIEALVVGSLAAWRLTYMIQEEAGPAAVFELLRARVYQMKDNSGSFREGYLCFHCMSVWWGLLLGGVYFIFQPLFWIIALPFAVSALAIFINGYVKQNDY